jgi:hypothetical protein
MQSIPEPGTVMYDCVLGIDEIREFGTSLEAILAGQSLPPEGVRIDVASSGLLERGMLQGRLKAMDYLHIRPDGKICMHAHGAIETHDGARIALLVEGVLTRRREGPDLDLRETVSLFTSDARYRWVNALQVRGEGWADMLNHKVIVQARVS